MMSSADGDPTRESESFYTELINGCQHVGNDLGDDS